MYSRLGGNPICVRLNKYLMGEDLAVQAPRMAGDLMGD